ncbi:hypothetical protein WG908_15280 [Sphingobium sp. AN641]|uniref:hypothetical protein n=1 Tax=Sphingobium sp. AN641 TaxID=3133443 RepID=UPI0030BE909E
MGEDVAGMRRAVKRALRSPAETAAGLSQAQQGILAFPFTWISRGRESGIIPAFIDRAGAPQGA